MHGAGSPLVKEAARRRLLALVDPALSRLETLLDEADTDSVRLRAARDILDRAGVGEPVRIEVSDGDSELDRSIAELLAAMARSGESSAPLGIASSDVAERNGQPDRAS